MQLNITQEEKAFLLHLLRERVNHPMKFGWVNPLDKDEVFDHEQMVQLHQKVTLA
jgi:hypothetical protein